MEWVHLHGSRVAVERIGSGKPVVWMHNAGCDSHLWAPVVERLATSMSLFLVDLPGFGRSDSVDSFQLDGVGRALLGVIDELVGEPVDVVGHCVGAAAALWLARRQPEKLKRMVLFNPASPKALSGGLFSPLYQASKLMPEGLSLPFVKRQLPRFAPGRAAAIRFLFGEKPCSDSAYVAHLDTAFRQEKTIASLISLLRHFEGFSEIDDPHPGGHRIRLIWGTHNRVLPWRNRSFCAKQIQADDVMDLAGAGHLCMREEPARIADAIDEWFSLS